MPRRLQTPIPVPVPRPIRLLVPLLFACPAFAQDDAGPDTIHKLTLGSYLSAGDYGAPSDTDIRYFPLSYEVSRFPWVVSLTVPYLALKGPGDVFLEAGNVGRAPVIGSERIDESGLGDINLSASYQFPAILDGRLFVDFTLQAKIPTADETRDLGTGETDVGGQLDFYTTTGRNTWFSSLGYRRRGKTPLYDLENSGFASLGYMRQVSDNGFLGLIYDYREKASSNSFEMHEVMPFYSLDLNEDWNLMVYTIAGFTDSSADSTFGLQVSYTFP